MKTIDILRLVDGVETVVYTVSTKDTSLDQELMKKDEVSINVTTEDPLYLDEGDYIMIDVIKYKINRCPESKLSSEKKNQYTITLEAPIYTLIDKYVSDKITGNTTITLTGKLKDFLELIVWNINYDKDSNPFGVDTGWAVGECPDTDYMNITFTATKCRDALNTLADKYGLEYYVTGKTINYVKYISNETGLVFTQGQGNGLYEIERQNIDSDDLVTRVFPKGGTDNVIPGEGDSEGRLILPEKYLENFSDSKRVVEAVVEFDSIHPSFTGTVANVSGTNNRSFTCPELDFDINDVAYGDGSERINFLTGDLMGKSFEFNWSSSEKKMTLVSQEDTLAPIDTATKKRPTIPSTSKYLRGGEKFNFIGIKLGDVYKNNAISQLREKATDWLGYYCRKRVKFVLDVDYRYLRQKNISLHLGDLITIKAPTHNINMIIRVTKIEKNLYTGKVSCTVSNYLDERWEKRIEDQVTEIKSTIETSNGGKWGETSVTILGREDPRTETDDNLYSTLRTNQEISDRALSKTDDDTAKGLITFLKGLCSKAVAIFEKGIKVIGGIITDSLSVTNKTDTTDLSVSNQAVIDKIVSSIFSSGQLGSGFTLYNQGGKSYMEIDELLVRVKAIFTSLEIRKLNYLGDNMLFTSAGCKISRVEETDTTYKCYFMSDDGTTATTNDFVVGDQVRCQTFNIKAGKYTNVSNKYYWRYVSAVGDGYIELSKTDCDANSDAPVAGDALVQLGNRTDSTRQNAIMLEVSGENAPAMIQYAGICGYSLSGKDTTVISPSGNKFVAKSFAIQVGDSIVKIPAEKGEWIKDTPYSYYDRVSHNGSLWLCIIAEGKTTTDEPVDGSTSWQKQVSKGKDGADGKNGNDGATGAKGDKGDTGTKGDDGYMCTLSPESVTLNDDENGNVTNLSLATTIIKLLKGAEVITPTIIVSATSGCSATISSNTVVITAIPQNTKQGYVDVLITSGSFNVTKRFSFQVIDYTVTKTIALNTANGALSLKADQKSVDALGKTVDQNSLDISANAKEIAVRLTSDDVKSSFTMDTDGISLLGKKILLGGMVTFQSLDSGAQKQITDAQGTANAAADSAKTANDGLGSLKNSLGGLAYEKDVEQAMKDKGIIDGAYIKMSLIDVAKVVASGIQAQTIDAQNATFSNIIMTNATVTGTINANAGTVGGFTINPGYMVADNGSATMNLSASLIAFKSSSYNTSAFIGANSAMPWSGIVTPATFISNKARDNYDLIGNVAIALSASGSKEWDDVINTGNHAIWIDNGDICGLRVKTRCISGNTTLTNMDNIILCSGGNCTITLPSSPIQNHVFWFIIIQNSTFTIASTTSNIHVGDSGTSSSVSIYHGQFLFMVYHNGYWSTTKGAPA
jgi:hypothetical protein